ncbi:MAG: hypothetical protein AAFO79_08620 [Pseudomonadota bacterium]
MNETIVDQAVAPTPAWDTALVLGNADTTGASARLSSGVLAASYPVRAAAGPFRRNAW